MRNIVDRATRLRDKFNSQYSGKSDLYGQQRRLFRRIREANSQVKIDEILPRPVVFDDRSSKDSIEGISRIQVEEDSYRVRGVSRRYAESDLKSASIDYIIRQAGFEDILCVLDELTPKTLAWDMVLKVQVTEEAIRWQ